MTTFDKFQTIHSQSQQRGEENVTKVLIITSVNDDDDDQKILSSLSPIDEHKRSPSESDDIWNDHSKNRNIKRRKADLTCLVCGDHAYGYNFGQIVCESCKAFFRRNAFHPIEKTKCLGGKEHRCTIRYDDRHKCQRCRLLKCLELGMRKDRISTSEQKLSKQQHLEENRRMSSTKMNTITTNEIKSESMEDSKNIFGNYQPLMDKPSCYLTEDDWSCLYHIQNAYLSTTQSSPSASSSISLDLESDQMVAYMNTLDLQKVSAVKSINFLRQIPDFEELDANDRLILVKYNLNLVDIMRCALRFDTIREVCYDDNITNSVSPDDEAFAERSKSLYILCYGYELSRSFANILHLINHFVDNDPIIVQLVMLVMTFSKGLSTIDDQEPVLNNYRRVYNAHSKFTDLLFRYLIQRSSYETAVIKMMRIVEVLLKLQRLAGEFHQQVKSKIDVNYINPLMKSLLNLN